MKKLTLSKNVQTLSAASANKSKSEKKKRKANDDHSPPEQVEITEEYIKDSKGVIEKHSVGVTAVNCHFNNGDYSPDEKACAPCSMRFICAHNAVALGNIEREAVLIDISNSDQIVINSETVGIDKSGMNTNMKDTTDEEADEVKDKISKKFKTTKKSSGIGKKKES
jgi:hypothetical protein